MRVTPEIKEKIRFYMARHAINQTELAEKIGVKHPSVNKWLNSDDASIKEPHAIKLCHLLGIDYSREMYRQSVQSISRVINQANDEKEHTKSIPLTPDMENHLPDRINIFPTRPPQIQESSSQSQSYSQHERLLSMSDIIRLVTESTELDAETKVTVLQALIKIRVL